MIKTIMHVKSGQKLALFLMIVGFMITIMIPVQNVLAQGTYYVGGTGASDSNPGSSTQPFLTIQEAATRASAGSVVNIRAGTYRETITPVNNGITFQPDQGALVVISGLNPVTTSWSVHNGSIHKTTITLPVTNYNLTLSSNTTLLNNQIFKDGAMMFEARYPNVTTEADLLDLSKFMHVSQIASFGAESLVDNGIPASGLDGAKLVAHGWFRPNTRIVSQPNANTLNYSNIGGLDPTKDYKYRKYYYVCGRLVLLDAEKEWFYDGTTLYFRQPGGGSPTGVEYKARNWGFDLRGKDNVTIKGIHFKGCEVATGDESTDNCVIDNVRATYTNHAVMMVDNFPGYGNAKQTGLKLLGSNNVIKNSEFRYTAAHGLWVGPNGTIENNLYQDCDYEGSWGAPFSFWGDADGVKILRNTSARTGRSNIDMGWSYTGGGVHQNHNIEVAYNDLSDWGMLNIDLGAIYSWGFRDLTGSVYHHNWIHDDGVDPDPTGANLDGGQRAIYFDQASGPTTVHHNVIWNLFPGIANNAGDVYNQMFFEHRNAGVTKWYNNTFAGNASHAYTTYEAADKANDVIQNNIWVKNINMWWGASNPSGENYNLFQGYGNQSTTNNVLGANSVNNTSPGFLAAGSGGLYYRLASGSAARSMGVVIPGITDDDDSSPDVGAYKFNDTWVAGYVAVPLEQSVAVTGVTVSPTMSSLVMGGTVQLTKAIAPSNATNQNVTWSSNTPGVATVNSSGLVTAVAVGNATITATTQDGSFTATSTITVYTSGTIIDNAVLGSGVNQHNYTGSGWVHSATQPTFYNSTMSFSNVTNDAMTLSFVGSKIEWYTEKMNHHGIVAVSIDNGTETNVDLYAANAGQQLLVYSSPTLTQGSHTFKIRATGTKNAASTGFYAIHDFVKVFSTGIPVTGVTVSPTTASLVIGGTNTVQLTKTIAPSNASNQNVTWSSSNTNIATVNSSGLVTAVAAGNATITATTQDGSFTATSVVTVYASASVTTIDNAVLGSGTNQHNYVGAGWVHGSSQPGFLNGTLSFSSVANNTVTLSFVGNRIEWYTEKMNTHGIAAVSIDNGTEVNVDLYSATAGQQLLVYSSPTLTQGTHTFKIRPTGTKNAASSNFYTVHDFVKVYSGGIPVTSVTVSPATASLVIGGSTTVQLTKTISPANATNQNVTWSSSNAAVATVNATGLVTAVSAGSATITATTQDGSFTSTSAITVNTITTIDDAILGTGVNQHNYIGAGWVHGNSQPGFLNGTLSFSNVTNNTVTLSFVGNKIEWYTEKMNHHGIAAVSIDNGTETNVDLYSSTATQQLLVYTSPTLTQGSHTFKIRATGTKNASSTGFYAIHDYVKIYSSASGGGGGGERITLMEGSAGLQVHPNPIASGNTLFLEVPGTPGELQISDMMGKLKYTLQTTERQLEIPTTGLADGVYLLHFRSSNGVKSIKIIIK